MWDTNGPDQPESSGQALVTSTNIHTRIPNRVSILTGGHGNACMGIEDESNAYALSIGCKAANRVLQVLHPPVRYPTESL